LDAHDERNDQMDLRERHVVVTGGSRGIGAALGDRFAAAGAKVTLVARTEADLAAAAERIGAGYLVCDLPDLSSLVGLVARLEAIAPVDILVNNAGLGTPGPLEEMTAAGLRDLFTLNALVPAELARLVIPAMRERGRGRLVFLSSLSAEVALPGLTAYSSTKAAVSQLAEGLRRDLKPAGIGVTTAELGPVDTGLYGDATAYQPCADAFNRLLKIGMLAMLNTNQVADAIVRACCKDKPRVVLPRRGGAQVAAARMPQWFANRVL
jgi:short-subunit dehydrogenase